jgi:hypothetical protein
MEHSQLLGKHALDKDPDMDEKEPIGRQKLDFKLNEGVVEDEDRDDMMVVEHGEYSSGGSEINSSQMWS